MGEDKDYGESITYDPSFKGPIHNRSCTDIVWLIIFVLFLGLWVFVGCYSYQHGDVKRLLAPIDSRGHRCGQDADVINKKYLVFFDIIKCLAPGAPFTGCPTPQVCVEECPTESILFTKDLSASNWQELRSKFICKEGVNVNSIGSYTEAIKLLNDGTCASYILQSEPVLFRCIGDLSSLSCNSKQSSSDKWPIVSSQGARQETCLRDPKRAQTTLMNRATALDTYVGMVVASWVTFFTRNERDLQVLSSQIIEDLVQSRWYMLGALFVVIVICFVYIILLRWVVGPVVWISITGLVAVLGFCIYLCYKNYAYYKANPVTLIQTTNIKGYAESFFVKHETWLGILITLAIVLVILVLIIIFLRGRIVIAIALIEEGSKAVGDIKSTVFFPVFPWILQCGVLAYGVFVLMYLMSMGESSFKVVNMANDTLCQCTDPNLKDYEKCHPLNFVDSCRDKVTGGLCQQATCHFVGLDSPMYVGWLHVVNLMAFFWTMFFVQGISDMMLASTFSTWYWTFNKKDLPFFTLTAGIHRTIRYHLGTVALGALIITIVRMIRVMLEYIDQKLKKFDNPFTRCLLCFCKCCFYCLENFLKFINKNAYIMCAVHGKSFCKSARDAFSLLMRNIVRVVVLDKVTDFVFFLSKLLISIGVGIAVYYIQKWQFVYDITKGVELHSPFMPAVILTIATYLITTIFFNVYSMSVDTLFLCFLEDVERNDGSPDKPYFMSKNLMKILNKRNKIE